MNAQFLGLHVNAFYLGLITSLLLYNNCPIYAGNNQPDVDLIVSDPKAEGDFLTLTIPLKRVQNLFVIEAQIDSLQGNFILDTGAPGLVLNKTYIKKWKVVEGSSSFGVTGGGGQVFQKNIDSLIIQDLFFTSVTAEVINLGHLEDKRGIKILGLLGANLFAGMEMEIDIKHNVLYLHKLDKEGNRLAKLIDSLTPPPDIELPLETVNSILFVNGTINNKKLRFCFDTGAETNVLSNTVSNKVLDHFILTKKTALSGSSNQSISVLNGKIDAITFGEVNFESEPFVLTNLSYLATVYNTGINGILGYQFMAKGKIIINVKKKLFLMYFYKTESK